MAQRFEKRGNRGFSMVETLAVVAILAILLSLSAVAAAYYRDYLRITELDNAARDIYMAAENRAVLLNSNGQLDEALAEPLAGGGEPAAVYFDRDKAVSLGLLTSGAIDPALMDNQFYIVYDKASGAVTDVFYTEGPENIQAIEEALKIAGDRDKRMRATPMLGYYGGQQGAGEPFTPLPAPEVLVEIHNEDRLWVDVTFTVPNDALAAVGNNWVFTAAQTVYLEYDGQKVTLLGDPAPDAPAAAWSMKRKSFNDHSITYTCTLDDLEDGQHFKDLFRGAGDFGGDFTVIAEIELSAPGCRPTSASGSDTNNSLFAEHSGEKTARLENLRHLQNLSSGVSNAEGKTHAVQLADIDCRGQETLAPDERYTFSPIVNSELISFNGGWTTEDGETRRNEISGLYVEEAGGPGGLFAETSEEMTFTGIRLMEANVTAKENAGALVGSAGGGVKFDDVRVVNSKVVSQNGAAGGIAGALASGKANSLKDCRVYWESDQDSLRHLLGSSETGYLDQITGKSAGGLIGEVLGSAGSAQTEIDGSFAASVIRGSGQAGGLIGSAAAPVTLTNSYADNYISGGEAAGLIGELGASGTITNCYAAGFIDMKKTNTAAGLTLGTAAITANKAYSVMSFTSQSIGGKTVYMVSEAQDGSTLTDTYYLSASSTGGSAGTAQGLDYETMSGSVFLGKMGGAFEFKSYRTSTDSRNTYPYNLQEKQSLTKYSFPGLKGLPHYGDWRAYFKEPSLVYYEKYFNAKNEESIGFSGGNARELIGQVDNDKVVKTDGYAVALLKKDLTANSFLVTYTYLDQDGKKKTLGPVTYSKSGSGDTKLLEAVWERAEGGETVKDEYWLAPLPKDLVIGTQTSPDFYQYLRFETNVKLNAGSEENAAGEYFYNPHFGETVKPYVPDVEGKPFIDWSGSWTGTGDQPYKENNAAAGVHKYITEALTPGKRPVSVNVRTPRHFYHLSQYEDYYHNERLSFQQRLTLDGHKSVYTGYQGTLLNYGTDGRGFQTQNPIGTKDTPFLGSYDGNSLPIRRLAFELSESADGKKRVCAGLFGSSNGTLQNIVYSLNPGGVGLDAPLTGDPRTVTFPSNEQETYLGALVGQNRSNGKIVNCAVDTVSLTTQIYTARLYIGGLCGKNEGSIQNSAAETALLHVSASNYGEAYVGGLVGYNTNDVRLSYAVGRLNAEAAQENAPVYLGGFVGLNSGRISQSYSAMHLNTDGVNAKAFGFCASSSGGRQSDTYYLNDGNFTYRGEGFLANYEDQGGAQPCSYVDLTSETSRVPSKLDKCEDPTDFPYPTGVTKGKVSKHYGGWPRPLKLGSMGVYYWEELQIAGKPYSYHVSLLAVDPGKSAGDTKISKISTLSTAHDEGGEVVRYGYGIYNKQGQSVSLKETLLPLLYSDKGGAGAGFNDTKYGNLESAKKNAAASSGSPDYQNRLVDEKLAELMSYGQGTGYVFHSFHSFSPDGSGAGGLYPNSDPSTPNGTLTLYQKGKYENNTEGTLKVTFAVNPLFADALAVVNVNVNGYQKDTVCKLEKGVPVCKATGADGNYTFAGAEEDRDETPGRKDNPFGVRSIDQLQFIDWNSVHRNTTTVLGKNAVDPAVDTISHFPYLSSSAETGKYFWKQSYDVLGKKDHQSVENGYTPIAEYYDWDGGKTGTLNGWFGGTYDGGTYMIKDVYVTGQKSSCAGLFGVVYNGSLENIVLYSSDGQGKIATKANQEGFRTNSRWFAMGGLAGVAGTSDPNSNAIKNCSIAGYTILAEIFTSTGDGDWGGGNIGGLVGSSHMNFSNCSAVAKVVVQNVSVNDHLRIGGLAGSCQGTVKSCYAGGSIVLGDSVTLASNALGIYIGGLVGGSYMKSLKVGNEGTYIGATGSGTGNVAKDETNNEIIDCYSYVTLPKLSDHDSIRSLYVVGGTGEIFPKEYVDQVADVANHGYTTYKNCYFLASEVLANFNGSVETYLEAIDTERGVPKPNKEAREPRTDLKTYIPGKTTIITLRTPSPESSTDKSLFGNFKVNRTTYYYLLSDGPLSGNRPANGTPLFTEYYDYWAGTTNYTFVGWWYGGSFVSKGTEIKETTASQRMGDNHEVTALTYEQLAGLAKGIPGKDPYQDIYQLLNAGKGAADQKFQPVTKMEGGTPVPGKYSYPPADASELRDRDYPFPTILVKDGQYNVHYGGWPLKGFERRALDKDGNPHYDGDGKPVSLGGSPIEIDLFVNGKAPHQEHLVLTSGIDSGGTWSYKWKTFQKETDQIAQVETPTAVTSDKIPVGERGKTYLLTLTPRSDGTDDLTITYTVGGVSYEQTVTVHITDGVELRPSRLFMFPSDTVEIGVKAVNKEGNLMTGGKLTLEGDPVCGSSGFLEAETTRAEAADGQLPSIRFTTKLPWNAADTEENRTLDANAKFTYDISGESHGGGSGGDIRVNVIKPWKDEEFIRFAVVDGAVVCTITFPNSMKIGENALHFETRGAVTVAPMPSKRPSAAIQTTLEGNIVVTLTYPGDVTGIGELPESTTISIPLKMTGENLIEGVQDHTMTLAVEKPKGEALAALSLEPEMAAAGPALTAEEPETAEETPEPTADEPEPTEEEPEPTEETPEPTEEEPEPTEETPESTEEEPEPTEETPEPTEEEPEPTEETPEPTEEEPEPTEKTPEPTEEEPEPTEKTPEPTEEEPEPTEETPEPTEEEPEPTEETPEPTTDEPEAAEETPKPTEEEP